MKTAFFLFDLAERMQGEGKARLFELSYTVSLTLANTQQCCYHNGSDLRATLGKAGCVFLKWHLLSCVYLYVFAGQLYKEIVEAHSNYPPNWDKNLALACERLLRSGHRGYSPDSLLTCSSQHFALYLEREPTDPQAPAIRTAITHLRKERDRLRTSHKQSPWRHPQRSARRWPI